MLAIRDYIGEDLSGKDLSGKDLSGFNFTGSILRNTDLSGSNLEGAILNKCDMEGAKLNGTFLGIEGISRLSLAKNYKTSVENVQKNLEGKMKKLEIKDQDMLGISCEKKGINKANPLNRKETCTLLNKKKDSYYIHTYNPTQILEKMKDFPDISNHFDLTIRHNCCNCISISLYFTDKLPPKQCVSYLGSIRRTVTNVRKNLPDWLVRLYLDSSVHRKMVNSPEGKYKKFIKDSLNFLIDAPNVEIYTYCCSKILDNSTPISRTRIFRFLPLSDPDVNIKIIREADGIVTNLDCHNIKIFSQSDYLFYLPKVIKQYCYVDSEIYTNTGGYSAWLRIYTKYLEKSYFERKHQTYDLLAGTFGVSLTLKQEYYDQSVEYIRKIIDKADRSSVIQYSPQLDILDIGFDEILLLHLYRDYVCCDLSNEDEIDRILSLIIASHNIVKYNIGHYITDKNSSLAIIQPLVKESLDKSLALLNNIMLSAFFSGEDSNMDVYPMTFLDAVLKPDNIKPDHVFDIEFGSDYIRERGILAGINIPYGCVLDHHHTHIKQLPYLDCLYDNI